MTAPASPGTIHAHELEFRSLFTKVDLYEFELGRGSTDHSGEIRPIRRLYCFIRQTSRWAGDVVALLSEIVELVPTHLIVPRRNKSVIHGEVVEQQLPF